MADVKFRLQRQIYNLVKELGHAQVTPSIIDLAFPTLDPIRTLLKVYEAITNG